MNVTTVLILVFICWNILQSVSSLLSVCVIFCFLSAEAETVSNRKVSVQFQLDSNDLRLLRIQLDVDPACVDTGRRRLPPLPLLLSSRLGGGGERSQVAACE